LSPSENVEQLLKFVIKENVSEFIEMHILVPFWHKFLAISITFIQLELIWHLWIDEEVVGFGILHFDVKSVLMPMSPDIPLAEHHNE